MFPNQIPLHLRICYKFDKLSYAVFISSNFQWFSPSFYWEQQDDKILGLLQLTAKEKDEKGKGKLNGLSGFIRDFESIFPYLRKTLVKRKLSFPQKKLIPKKKNTFLVFLNLCWHKKKLVVEDHEYIFPFSINPI